MGTTPHNLISSIHQKLRGHAPGGCRTIINKQEGGTLYQKTHDSWLFITRPLSNIYKQPGPMWINLTMLLWLLTAQYNTHVLSNTKQMANKTDPYRKERPVFRLPLDTWKYNNRGDMHSNSRRASISLPAITLWNHTCNRRIYDCQWSGNRPRKRSTPGRILGHRWPKLTTQILTTTEV